MNKVLEVIDPSTMTSEIIVGIIITLVSTGIIAFLVWSFGPLKWFIQSRRLQKILTSGRHFTFVFNPEAQKSKPVTFLPNGQIGEGRNSNEHTWRIRLGKLEIIAFDSKVYSRFVYNPKTGKIEHTNDSDTRSVLGQYFVPQFKSWKQESRTTT
ncbi:MAG: hypothetical protein ABSG22_11300 [Sedimentisphaerales bacterium]|jgi:hypothetical protein